MGRFAMDKKAKRVVRGGSWNNNGRNLRSATRNRNEPDNRNNNVGLRLSLAQPQPEARHDEKPIRPCEGKQIAHVLGTLVGVASNRTPTQHSFRSH